MTLEEGFYAFASTKASIVAVTSTRIYPIVADDETLPAIVYQNISRNHIGSLLGSSQLQYTTLQVTCLAATYSQAKNLAEIVRNAMDGFTGTWGSPSGVEVQECLLADEGDIADNSVGNQQSRSRGVRLDFRIAAYETAPTL